MIIEFTTGKRFAKFYCCVCLETLPIEQLRFATGGPNLDTRGLCKSCHRVCDDCGLDSMNDYDVNYNGEITLCEECGTFCYGCDALKRFSELVYDDEIGEYYCHECNDRRGE